MSYLLRKISRQKWISCIDQPIDQYSGDAITGCTRTSSDTLSVWISDSNNFDAEHNKKLIVALALSMPNGPATFDVVFLNPDDLISQNIEISDTNGDTPFEGINPFHRDLISINHRNLGIVANEIVLKLSEEQNFKRISKADSLANVMEFLGNEFEIDELNSKWQEAIRKKLNSLN